MEGIVGVWKPNGNTVVNAYSTSKMLEFLSANSTMHKQIASLGTLSMGQVQFPVNGSPEMISVDEQFGLMVAIDGDIYNKKELIKYLKLQENEINNDASLILAGYKQVGTKVISMLNGQFAIAIWCEKDQILHLATDLLGTRFLYLRRSEKNVFFASAIRAMSVDPSFTPKLNWTSIAQHLCLEYVLGSQTLISDVKLLPVHSITSVTIDTISSKKYWEFPYYTGGRFDGMGVDDIVHDIHFEYLKMAENTGNTVNKPCIGLTGGLDSRLLGAYFAPKLPSLVAVTVGYPGSYDVHLAKDVAKILNCTHYSYTNTIDTNYFINNMPFASVITEGSFNTVEFIELGKKLARHGDIALMGSFGSELSGLIPYARYMDIANLSNFKVLAKYICEHKSVIKPETLCKLTNIPELQHAAMEVEMQLYHSMEETPGESLEDRLAIHELVNRQRRRTLLAMHMVGEFIRCRYPLLENRSLFEAFLQLPWSLRHDRRIYKILLSKYFPKLASLDTGVRRFPVKWELHMRPLYRIRDKTYYLMQRYVPRLAERIISLSNLTADVQVSEECYRKDFKNTLMELLVDGKRQQKLWAPEIAKQMINEHVSKKHNYRRLFHRMVALELFLLDFNQQINTWKK